MAARWQRQGGRQAGSWLLLELNKFCQLNKATCWTFARLTRRRRATDKDASHENEDDDDAAGESWDRGRAEAPEWRCK